jgi:hypothetical protein
MEPFSIRAKIALLTSVIDEVHNLAARWTFGSTGSGLRPRGS